MATQLGQFNVNTYILSTDNNGVIVDLKFKSANQNTVTAGYDGSKVTFKNGDTSLSVEAALSAGVALSAETCTGNAATASKLQTPRTIGGISLDGSSDIDLPGVNTAGNQNTSGNAATASKLQTARKISGVDFDGSKDINLPAATTSLSGMMSSEDKMVIESLKEIQFDTWTFDYEGGSMTKNIAFKS